MKKKILLADNNAETRALLREILYKNYKVYEAKNGEELLSILENSYQQLSAIVMDRSLPVIDGYEVLKRKQRDKRLSQIPVIVTTESWDISSEKRALSLGAQDYILKACDAEIFLHRLNNVIKMCETAARIKKFQIDKLTGVLNRKAFFECADKLIHEGKPGDYVLSCFDIDNFKIVNYQYGYNIGDTILKQLSYILKNGFSKVGGIVGRIMADNFAVLYPVNFIKSREQEEIFDKAKRLDGTVAPISFTIGRYIVEDLSLTVSDMYDRAVIAKAFVKGRYDYKIGTYDETMRQNILLKQTIITEMHHALVSGQFVVWYQPQFNHSTGALIGAEALVRWNHPKMGLIPPGDFIPAFERNGFIYELDKYILEHVCAFLRQHIDEGHSPFPISVNISRCDIFHEDFISVTMEIINKYDIPISMIRFEITESAFSEFTDQIRLVVSKLIEYGFIVEIDDFGSGYSSLNILKDIPAQIAKLDMKFLEGDDVSGRGGNIIESVVRMSKWIGMSLIAEGVETKEQADFLKSIGCNYVQGYFYARPMPQKEYEALIESTDSEEKTIKLQTVENFDNNEFWNPNSIDSLIFNSYVGNACILEYVSGKIELLRATDHFVQMFNSASLNFEDALKLDWLAFMDTESVKRFNIAVNESIKTKQEVSCEVVFLNLPGCPEKTYLHSTYRVIAAIDKRYLIYCLNEDITSQRVAEKERLSAIKKIYETDEQLKFLNEVANNLLAQPDLEVGINNVLHKILYHFDADRAYIIEYNETMQIANNTYEVCAPGVESEMANLQSLPRSRYQYWFSSFDRSNYINIDNVSALPDSRQEERTILQQQNIQQLIAVPFHLEGKLMGFIGIDNPHKCQSFVEHLLALSDYIAVMLTRRNLHAKSISDYKLMRTLLDDTPGGFTRLKIKSDGKPSVEYVNESFCRMRGMTAERILAEDKNDASVAVHPDDIKHVFSVLNKIIDTGEKTHTVYRLRHADGSYIPFNAFIRVTKNEVGEKFINIYYTELSNQDKKDYSIQEAIPFVLSTIMESTTELSFAKNKSFVYVCCSKPFAQMAGFENESDIIGKTDYDLFDKATADRFRADDLKLIESGKSLVDYIEPIPSADGLQHYSRTSKYILCDSTKNIVGLYGTGRDVTQIQAVIEQLKNSVALL